MSTDSARVIWSEGLFLRPHHFQQQERFFEALLEARLNSSGAFGHGFSLLTLDRALLPQGKLAIAGARGVLPDGTPFEVPSSSARLRPFDVPPDTRDAPVYLSAVLREASPKLFSLEESDRRARFDGVDSVIMDNVFGFESEAEVKLGVLSLSLGLQDSLDGGLTSLQVARIQERRADGSVVLDERFVPPLLDVAANIRMHSWVEELYGLLKQRGDALAARIGAPGTKGVADFADFLLLLVCNRFEPLMSQMRQTSPLHPFALHAELLKLAGECATFGRESRRPPALPTYRHTHLAETFEPVVEEIRRAMAAVSGQNVVPIALRELGQGLYGADIPDPKLVGSAFFVLAATANIQRETLRSRLPTQVKIGPPDKIRDLVMGQVPGIMLEAIEAPRQLPFHANHCYFQLDARSEYWRSVEVSRRLALHVAGEPPGLQLQLWAIRT